MIGQGRSVDALLGLSVLAVIQAALVPYDFSLPGNNEASSLFASWREPRFSLPDFLSNLALYLPLGGLAAWSLFRIGTGLAVSAVRVIGGATLLSTMLEGVQSFSASRVSSPIDVAANTLGALFGVLVAAIVERVVARRGTSARAATIFGPAVAASRGYILILVAVGTAPWTLSLDVGRLREAVDRSQWTPFQTGTPSLAAENGPAVTNEAIQSTISRHHAWTAWLAEAASFALLAHLLWLVLRRELSFGSGSATAMAVWIGGGLAIGLSALQFPIISRGFDITDPIVRLLGLGIGWMAHGVVKSPAPRRNQASIPRTIMPDVGIPVAPAVARVGVGFVVAYLAITGFSPFEFRTPGATHGGWGELAPFHSLALARFDRWLLDAVGKVAAFAALAACLTASSAYWWETRLRVRWARSAVVCLMVAMVGECAQFFLPGRTAGLSDPVLALIGGWLGVVTLDWHVRSIPGCLPQVGSRPNRRAVRSADRVGGPRSLTDELVGSLAEPHADAPRERGLRSINPGPE